MELLAERIQILFTGMIDHSGMITQVARYDSHCRFTIQTHFSDLVSGESIAVDGACLTVTSFGENFFTVEVSSETLALTTADTIKRVAELI